MLYMFICLCDSCIAIYLYTCLEAIIFLIGFIFFVFCFPAVFPFFIMYLLWKTLIWTVLAFNLFRWSNPSLVRQGPFLWGLGPDYFLLWVIVIENRDIGLSRRYYDLPNRKSTDGQSCVEHVWQVKLCLEIFTLASLKTCRFKPDNIYFVLRWHFAAQ